MRITINADDTLKKAYQKLELALFEGSEKFKESGNSFVLTAIDGMRQLVQHSRIAYAEELDKTIAKVNPLLKDHLNSINQIIDDLGSITDRTVTDISEVMLILVHSLPFTGKTPKVISYFPNCLAGDRDTVITVTGIFPPDSCPTFHLEGRVLEPFMHITTQLQFLISKELFDNVEQETILRGNLKFKKPESFLSSLIFSPKYETFKTALIAFPQFAGKVSIISGLENTAEQAITLRWGESVVKEVVPSRWKVSLDAYNGSHYEFITQTLNHAFVQIKDLSSHLIINIVQPSIAMMNLQHVVEHVLIPQNPKIEEQLPVPAQIPPVTPLRKELGHVPINISASDFKFYGRTCPAPLKSYTYLFREHINKSSTLEIRWAAAHKVVAIYKSGKWRFYWVGPPSNAIIEKKGKFEKVFEQFKPLYLQTIHQPILCKL